MLNDKQIKALKPRVTAYYETDDTGRRGHGRLAVKVYPTGRKVFYFAYKTGSKRQFIALGDYPTLSLKEATATTNQYGQWLFEGKDPKDILSEQAKSHEAAKRIARVKKLEGSVGQLFSLFIAKAERERSAEYHKAVKRVLGGEMQEILGAATKANTIEPAEIARALRPIAARGSLVMANRARAYLSAAFAFGLQFDFSPERQEDDPLFNMRFNPCDAVPKALKSEQASDRVLSEEEIKQFWELIETSKLPVERKILLKLLIVFGGRRVNEVIKAPWSEFDLKEGLWDRPANRDKKGHHTLTPIGGMANELLSELRQITGHTKHLFGEKPPTDYAVNQSVQRLIRGRMEPFSPKCLRATAKTLMGKIGITKADRDMYHAHALTDVSSKHYDKYHYLPEKRAVVRRWEAFIKDVIAGHEHEAGLRLVKNH